MQPERSESPEASSPQDQAKAGRSRHPLGKAGVMATSLGVIVLAGLFGLWLGGITGRPDGHASPPPGSGSDSIVPRLGPESIAKWEKPELAIILSGEMHGYLLPCGCSEPQIGGLERRYNFMKGLKDKGWPLLAVDLGDIAQAQIDVPSARLENIQALPKYVTAMKSLKAMDYLAIGIGWRERVLNAGDTQGLPVALDNWALNEPKPRILAMNLLDRGENDRWMNMVGSWQAYKFPGSRLKVSVTGIVGKSVRDSKQVQGEKDVRWADNGHVIEQALKEQAGKDIDMRILLYQGTVDEAEELLKRFPKFHVVLCKSDDPLAPEKPKRVGNSLIVTVGHKGKDVGVIGVFEQKHKPETYEMRYQLVDMDPSLATPKDKQKDHPIVKLMEEYTNEMAKHPEQYLLRYKQVSHPMQIQFDTKDTGVEYVGSLECKRCHPSAFDKWVHSKHGANLALDKTYDRKKDPPPMQPYETLVKAKNPSHRQYDGECVVCHVTGFGYRTGFRSEKDVNFKLLANVGCEACHGPGSAHIDNPKDMKIREAMNPWKLKPAGKPRELAIGEMCQKCHDLENDVHWKFDKRWPSIDHPNPKTTPAKGSVNKPSDTAEVGTVAPTKPPDKAPVRKRSESGPPLIVPAEDPRDK